MFIQKFHRKSHFSHDVVNKVKLDLLLPTISTKGAIIGLYKIREKSALVVS
jgi:hypothetical protein